MSYVVARTEGSGEIESESLVHVLRQYAHVVIAVFPHLFMEKTRSVPDFVDHCRHAAVILEK